jgi:hypothetical protein
MVGADQPVDHGRLMLLDAPHLRERELQLRPVHARRAVREAVRFQLDAVHEDDAHARVRIVVQLADRRLHQVAPGELLLLQRHAAIFQQGRFHARMVRARLRHIESPRAARFGGRNRDR